MPPEPVTSSRWLKHLAPDGGDLRIVCFPHSGGAANGYRPLAGELAGRAGVVAVQYPGRQERHDEPVVTDLHELADLIAAELRAAPPDPRRVFFGHSMGAILAYEVARRLGDDGPAALVASARPAPSVVRVTGDHLLDDDAFAGRVTALGGTASEVLADPEMRALLLPMIRGDYRASETYRRRDDVPLRCPLTAVAATGDPAATVEQVRHWRDHTTGPFRLVTFPGGHFYLHDRWPAVAELVLSAVDGA